jgi:aryl-alcohol dehydrogenase-like predicted oxidoreductase
LRRLRLGSSGPELSRVGFGTWALGGPWLFGWGEVDDDESARAIETAVAHGVNWVETAPVYGVGHAEEVVGRALRSAGDGVLVFTKCGRVWREGDEDDITNDLRPESIRRECETSLRRLGRETIDVYQFHWPDWSTGTPLEDSWGAMAQLVDEGKVRWLGVCNFDVDQLDRCESIRHVDSVQSPLSLLARGARSTVLDWAREHESGFLAYSPMASGLLTGAFDRARIDALPHDDWRRLAPAFHEPQLARNLVLIDRLRSIADGLGTTVAALAVAWVLAQEGVTGAIVGARRAAHVSGWLPAATLELDTGTLAAVDAALAESGAGSDEPPVPPPHMTHAAVTAREDGA